MENKNNNINLLQYHFNSIEKLLNCHSNIASESGHNTDKGTLRETFIKEFLMGHLSDNVSIGTGEIIDCNSIYPEKRNQIDIIIYKNNYPKVPLGIGINCFFIESVVSTIEIKSFLDKDRLFESLDAIRSTKKLISNIQIKDNKEDVMIPPGFLSIIFAYDGLKIDTIYDHLSNYINYNNIAIPETPINKVDKVENISPIVDLIVILGKGFVRYDNSVLSFDESIKKQNPNGKWWICNCDKNNIFYLFSQLAFFVSHLPRQYLTISPYTKKINYPNGSIKLL